MIVAALFRSDYGKPLFWGEKAVAALFMVLTAVVYLGVGLLGGRFSLPMFLAYFTFGVIMVRVVSPLTDRNIAQLIFLSVGLVLANCILTNHIVFALILPVYLFLLMGTLMSFHLAKSGVDWRALKARGSIEDRSGPGSGGILKYMVVVLILTVVVFLLMPRPFPVIPGLRAAMAGGGGLAELAPQISYRDMASMAGSNRIAFMARFEKGSPPAPTYWRGRVLARTDGMSWSSSGSSMHTTRWIRPEPSETLVYRILPYRLRSRILYVCGVPVTALGRRKRQLLITREGEVIIDTPFLFSNSYKVKAVTRPIPEASRFDPINLDAAGITPRISELALKWTRGATTRRGKAEAILERLRRSYEYELVNPPVPRNAHPLEQFLFNTRTGNCEYFAGSMALMLRAVDVPSRVVEGFLGKETTSVPNEFIVRFSRAHAWVEALLEDSHWTTLDPTPAGRASYHNEYWNRLTDLYDELEYRWIDTVVNFDRSDQLKLLKAFSRLLSGATSSPFSPPPHAAAYLMVTLVAAALAVVTVIGFRRYVRNRGEPSTIYLATMRDMVRKGALDRIHPWHEENVDRILNRAPYARESLSRFMSAYLKERFGNPGSASGADLRKARRELNQDVVLFKHGRARHEGRR